MTEKERVLTTRDIVAVMLGKKLKTSEVIDAVRAAYPECRTSRRAIRNRIINLSVSRNAVMQVLGDSRIKTWHLVSVDECYHRKSTQTRLARQSSPQLEDEPKSVKPRIRPKMEPRELAYCLRAKEVCSAWQTVRNRYITLNGENITHSPMVRGR
ncbi:hypothetical protein JY462_07695 [Serratia marcescens]|nr:hypothetical protein [Serratia marcescens]